MDRQYRRDKRNAVLNGGCQPATTKGLALLLSAGFGACQDTLSAAVTPGLKEAHRPRLGKSNPQLIS